MTKKHTSIMFAFAVIISIGMFILYLYSPLTAEIYRGNFVRNFSNRIKLIEKEKIDLRHNSYYIAGITQDKIYLGNYTRPFLLTILDRRTKSTKKIQLEISKLDTIPQPDYFKLIVTPKYFYMMHGILPAILRGKTGTWKAEPLEIDKNDYFDQIIPLGPNSFALRFYNGQINGYAIGKKRVGDTSSFHYDTALLQRQVDGVFSVDGTLHYSEKLKQLVYLYAYRNEYIVSDSNLSLTYRANTIDTFKRADMQIANVTESRQMLASTAAVINKNSCIYENILLVESNVLSKTEQKDQFLKSSVIDAYRLDDHAYLYSFYITGDHKLSEFKTHANNLVTISNETLTIYDIDNRSDKLSKTLPVRPQE